MSSSCSRIIFSTARPASCSTRVHIRVWGVRGLRPADSAGVSRRSSCARIVVRRTAQPGTFQSRLTTCCSCSALRNMKTYLYRTTHVCQCALSRVKVGNTSFSPTSLCQSNQTASWYTLHHLPASHLHNNEGTSRHICSMCHACMPMLTLTVTPRLLSTTALTPLEKKLRYQSRAQQPTHLDLQAVTSSIQKEFLQDRELR